jgi:dienelactone hydrolase
LQLKLRWNVKEYHMSEAPTHLTTHSTLIDHIPVLWCAPASGTPRTKLVIWLNGLSGTKEQMLPYLQDLAAAGCTSLSFDAWQHGGRGSEAPADLATRVFGNFRRFMWPILGQTTLDTLRVIDWAIATLDVEPTIFMGGISMGGDISVAAAGIDHRIERVAAIVATPDWLRPGMQDLSRPGTLLSPGVPDAYAQYFYDQLNPLTHLDAYTHGPAITFECAANDTHVPPDGALRFQAALRDRAPTSANRIRVNLHSGAGHMDAREPLFWQHCLAWFSA